MAKPAAVVALVASVLLTAACGGGSEPSAAPSAAPSALQSYIAKHYRIQLSALPPRPTTISADKAEDLASASFPKKHGTIAGLWRVSDPELYIPEHGIHRLLVNNQVGWIVLVHGVNIEGAPTPSGATGASAPPTPQWKPVFGTEAVFVNAESGNRTESWSLPARIH